MNLEKLAEKLDTDIAGALVDQLTVPRGSKRWVETNRHARVVIILRVLRDVQEEAVRDMRIVANERHQKLHDKLIHRKGGRVGSMPE